MRFLYVLFVATVLQMTEVHAFFGWWKKTQAPKAKPVPENFANLNDAVRNFQLENYGLVISVGTTFTL